MLYQNLQIKSGAGTIAAPVPGTLGTSAPDTVEPTQAEGAPEAPTVFTAVGEILRDLFARMRSADSLVLDTPHRMAPTSVRR